MMYYVTIENSKHTFPLKGLNELLSGRIYNFRTKKYHNEVKHSNDRICIQAIKKCIGKVKLNRPIKCTFYIFAQDKRHDRGNLSSACEKSFLDGLQAVGCLSNDGFDDVWDSSFYTHVDKLRPRIEVVIEEVKGE